ncbi:eukaryotic translation initiation factor 2-alpha kinase isoform X2 [Periplaneta americana]|uniref:eukaryotic translation initiation factor 2-alpha kinase isoform X2 n=1 Tax=Periplaneta americana TaxID=6978 RepID=UPI0037E910EB
MANFSIFSLTIVVAFYFAASVISVTSNESKIGELPYCGPDKLNTNHKLVFVSTLDGRLSALDPADGGSLSWSIETGPGQMLSSSIHRLELTNNGQWVRMIPSLSGGIYRFNGTSIEPVPITADLLLKSAPFTFSSELAISGGKETRTYGVVAKTGQVMYECSMEGCTNSTDNLTADDVIVIQRHTQTVRAIEARTGVERWNFSVGQHEVSFVSDIVDDCHQKSPTPSRVDESFELKVIVPEGLICAVSKTSGKIIWKQKFDAPVVAAWHLQQGQMYPVDLFSGAQWTPNYNDQIGPMTPSLYIGMHNRQLYIQESVTLHERVGKMSTELARADPSLFPRIPWAPVPATDLSSLATPFSLAFVGALDADPESESTELGNTELTTIARSFLYASEYVNGNGYYLFSTPKLQCSVSEGNSTIEKDDDDVSHKSDGHITTEDEIFSVLHWWKEIVIFIVSICVVVNLVVSQKLNIIFNLLPGRDDEVMGQKMIVVEKPIPAAVITEAEPLLPHRSNSDPGGQQPSGFVSRYLTDFNPVHCLGKGGFGVVFEARNKIDDCHYAIKRIPLPNRQESRERVMREVKALAKLDHHNIVRYFNAWLECPPPGWQEEQDKLVPNCDAFCSLGEAISIDLTNQTRGTAPIHQSSQDVPSKKDKCSPVYLNVGSESESESYAQRKQIPRCNPDQSDSYIVFEGTGDHESELTVDDDENDKSWCGDNEGTNALESEKELTSARSCSSTENSSKCLSAWGEETRRKRTSSTTESHENKKKLGHRRPASLDISSGGGIVLPPPRISRMYLFIQMQLCRRESLREWLRENVCNRSTALVLPMFEQIVQAVEYVHLQGLIHRDLKPSNIFFSLDGQIKVGDFGLVTAMVESSAGQRTPSPDSSDVLYTDDKHTARVGTQLYMSPEQAQGLPYNYKVDIYSLGVILFELLVPFGTDMERSRTLMDIRNNKFPEHFQQQYQQEIFKMQSNLFTRKFDKSIGKIVDDTSNMNVHLSDIAHIQERIKRCIAIIQQSQELQTNRIHTRSRTSHGTHQGFST